MRPMRDQTDIDRVLTAVSGSGTARDEMAVSPDGAEKPVHRVLSNRADQRRTAEPGLKSTRVAYSSPPPRCPRLPQPEGHFLHRSNSEDDPTCKGRTELTGSSSGSDAVSTQRGSSGFNTMIHAIAAAAVVLYQRRLGIRAKRVGILTLP